MCLFYLLDKDINVLGISGPLQTHLDLYVIYSSSFFISFHWNFLFLCIFLLKKFGIYFLSSNYRFLVIGQILWMVFSLSWILGSYSMIHLFSRHTSFMLDFIFFFSRNYFCIHNPLIRLSLCVSFTFFISIWSLVTLLMISSNKDVRASTS